MTPKSTGVRGSAPTSAPARLGLWRTLALSLSGIIGSGWLASIPRVAGLKLDPWAAVLAWLVAAAALTTIAIPVVRLATVRQESGSLIAWPGESSGPVVGSVMGAGLIIVYAGNPPALAALVGAWLQDDSRNICGNNLDGRGALIAGGIMLALFAANWYGLSLVARLNLGVTALKIGIPVLFIVVMLANRNGTEVPPCAEVSTPTPSLLIIDVIITTGIMFSFTGFQGPTDLAGSTKDPRLTRTAILTALAVSALLYVALQLAYTHWPTGGSFTLIMLLSPLATAMVFIYFTATNLQVFAHKQLVQVPGLDLSKLSGPREVPRNALAFCFAVGLLMLLLFGGWEGIATAKTVIFLFLYSYAAISYTVFRRASGDTKRYPWKFTVIGPLSVSLATVIAHFSGFDKLLPSYLLLCVISLLVLLSGRRYSDLHSQANWHRARWLFAYFGALLVLSWASWRKSGPENEWGLNEPVNQLLNLIHEPPSALAGSWVWQVALGILAAALGAAAYYVGVQQALELKRDTGSREEA